MAIASPLDTYEGVAVPLYPKYGTAIQQNTAAGGYDLLTLQLGSSASDDILVLRKSTTECFVVEDGGNVVMTQSAAADIGLKIVRYSTPSANAITVTDNGGTATWGVTKNAGISWKVRTTRPTTGLVKGEMFVAFHGSSPKICICTSTAGQTVKQVRAKTKTFGRLTA
jgi:hypothetical protein